MPSLNQTLYKPHFEVIVLNRGIAFCLFVGILKYFANLAGADTIEENPSSSAISKVFATPAGFIITLDSSLSLYLRSKGVILNHCVPINQIS